ncbi:hypothetical protein [Streptomyces scabiei]|uniref:hypothetical protein n=1 Tax=Streptomyces scabiei TaxID=1930 RepID=UPI0029A1D371|nr:hypothetical protein [Streptomyces scabiei]MDX2804857.1 hypothetical protein [Streptomyces scabiei]
MTDEEFIAAYEGLFTAQESAYADALTELRTALDADTGPLGKLVDAVTARAKLSGLTDRWAGAQYRSGNRAVYGRTYSADAATILTEVVSDMAQAAKEAQAVDLNP